MSIFDDYVVATAALGNALVSAAEGAFASPDDVNDPDRVAFKTKVRDAYIIARVNVAVAEALAKQAVLESGDDAVKLVKAAALMVGKSEQQLLDAAAREKAAVEQTVKNAYQSAVDLGVRAVSGVEKLGEVGVKSVLFTFEAQVLIVLAVLGGAYYLNKEKKKGPSAAEMRRAVLVGEP